MQTAFRLHNALCKLAFSLNAENVFAGKFGEWWNLTENCTKIRWIVSFTAELTVKSLIHNVNCGWFTMWIAYFTVFSVNWVCYSSFTTFIGLHSVRTPVSTANWAASAITDPMALYLPPSLHYAVHNPSEWCIMHHYAPHFGTPP